jgi:hypothetical protein
MNLSPDLDGQRDGRPFRFSRNVAADLSPSGQALEHWASRRNATKGQD